MKKQLLLFLCLFSVVIGQSQTFNDGVLEYTVTDDANKHVSVKMYDGICPTSDLVIPETIVNSGTTYIVTSIENDAFKNCKIMTSVSFPDSITSIGEWAFYYCSGLTSLDLPKNLETIGEQAFSVCQNVTSVTFPKGLKSIGYAAFKKGDGLTSIDLPKSITDIGKHAFTRCFNITSVTVHWEDAPVSITEDVFYLVTGGLGSLSLSVPAGAIPVYQAAPVWKDFGSFIPLSISDFASSLTVSLYPNPTSAFLNINLNGATKLKRITIYNSLGQLVAETNTSRIDVSSYSKGLYLAQVETDNAKASKRFLIE